ncbi:MAG: calcium/sodium antiporter [Bacteroidales bacterium]|nr:calcium/sodium antiporter [Bacteroidales bacterium]MDD2323520.1 calcium/sodium antiporter [Bacteroidales bacterium]MDD3960444.1 calcium/sodium antiporter [Bacteroidales bacterium]MDY0285940.1 calcium/sodium antiporter [Bacteroidales bacterium]HPE86125.1 calcium/sodium antiporter [Bacteroidales bacterium]
MTETLFFTGFIILVIGANILVKGSSAIGQKLGIPSIVIGMTIVAFGTSLPELVISSFAAYRGETDLAITNVLGSNLLNILLILGISAIILPIPAKKSTTNRVIPASFLLTVFLILMMYTFNQGRNVVNRTEGIVLLLLFVLFLYLNKKESNKSKGVDGMPRVEEQPVLKSLAYVILGLAALFISGRWIVNGASAIAADLGISQSVIGFTLVSLSTSLPELVTSVMAAIRKNTDIAIGNVIGSNILNILVVLGVSATIRPLPVYEEIFSDLIMVLFATFVLFLMLFTGRKRYILHRHEGALLLLIYLIYITTRII